MTLRLVHDAADPNASTFELTVPMIRPSAQSLELVPPLSANGRQHWRVTNQRIKLIRQHIVTEARRAHVPACKHMTVQLHYRPGDNRRRDADNLYPTFKAACDALARGPRRDWVGLELVPDDTPEHMTKLAPVIHPGPGVRRLWLTVEVTRG